MSDELLQAVSFANGYFTLADSLPLKLEEYLDENVVLEWFGQIIKGRENVAEFMKNDKIKSRHVFNDINLTDFIESPLQNTTQKKNHSFGNINFDNDKRISINPGYKRKYYSEGYNKLNKQQLDNDYDETEIDIEEFDNEFKKLKLEPDVFIDSSKIDFDNFTISKINCNKEEETLNEVEKKIIELTEINEGKMNDDINNDSGIIIKYINTCGIIEFARSSPVALNQIRKDIRKRQCKLQIAYSIKDHNVIDDDDNLSDANKSMELDNIENTMKRNIEETSVLNCQTPVGYFDPDEDRKQFLKYLNLELTSESNIKDFVTPKYIKNQQNVSLDLLNDSGNSSKFIFNYNIHLIIYESNTKCRLNLTDQFEDTDDCENI